MPPSPCWWTRAADAADAGVAVQVSLALHKAAGPPPPEVLRHGAAAFAHAALVAHEALPARRLLARALAAAVGVDPGPDDLTLAWQVLVPATDLTDPTSPARTAHLLLLGALAAARGDDGTALLRSAQELARRQGDTASFSHASDLLAAQARRDGDEALAAAIEAHKARLTRG